MEIPISINIGKMSATHKPAFKSPPVLFAIMPTTVGPEEQPRSPARAISAYMAVPPPGSFNAAMLKVPGQKIPTENPQMAQPIRPIIGFPVKAVII